MSETTNPTPEPKPASTPQERVAQLEKALSDGAAAGVQATSVDGVSVTKMSSADRKIALDEAKKAAVTKFPLFMTKWK